MIKICIYLYSFKYSYQTLSISNQLKGAIRHEITNECWNAFKQKNQIGKIDVF